MSFHDAKFLSSQTFVVHRSLSSIQKGYCHFLSDSGGVRPLSGPLNSGCISGKGSHLGDSSFLVHEDWINELKFRTEG